MLYCLYYIFADILRTRFFIFLSKHFFSKLCRILSSPLACFTKFGLQENYLERSRVTQTIIYNR